MITMAMQSNEQDMDISVNCSSDSRIPPEICPMVTKVISAQTRLSTLQSFYAGHSIFITGCTGFIGKLLIEKLLRCCPGILFIYLLIRPKKDMNAHRRAEEIFNDVVFSKLEEAVPNFRRHLVVIAGDCNLPDLGISAADRITLIKEVSIVFHAAAAVRFDMNLKLAVAANVQGPQNILKLCKEMPKLMSIVHVSTAFSNCPQQSIEEKFYEPPIEAKKLISLVDCLTEKLVDYITPKLLGEWPNTYVFTKAVAEHIVKEEADDLPIGIFRPSIIISTLQEPMDGWTDNNNGATGVIACAEIGLLRTIHCNGSLEANLVPGDLTVNALIACAWDVANTPRHLSDNSDIPIYNYVSSDNPITWKEFEEKSAKYGIEEPTTKALWYYCFSYTKSKFLHQLLVPLLHFLPAMLIDIVCLCMGRKMRLLNIYKKIHKLLDVLNYFTTREWKFSNDRVTKMLEKLQSDDKETFYFNIKDLVWDRFFQTYSCGIRVYLFRDPLDTLPQARIKYRRLYWMHQALKLTITFMFIRILWSLVTLLLSLSTQ